jgi:uncharacterized protein (DUF1015 family)
MRIYAFEGLRYGERAGDAGPLAAPPYDQINDAARDRFQAQDPHQFAHLTRPLASDAGDPFQSAKALHDRWLAEGSIVRDGKPALYPYVIELATGGERLGLLALVRLEDAKVIRPHEQTLAKPLAERLSLLEAMRVDLEPALLVSEDGGKLDALLREDLRGASPLVRHQDADGHWHVLYRIDDPARIGLYREALDVPAAIADGHHRYKVAQRFAATHPPAPDTAAGAKLAVVTSLDSPALTIDPIHRAFKTPVDRAKLLPLAASVSHFDGDGGAAFAAAVAAAVQPALGIFVHGDRPQIWSWSREGGERLAVEIFQDEVLPALGLPPEASTDGTVVYRANPEELWAQVQSGELGTGVFLPPMLPAAFAAAIADGQMLPAKSTRFLPKVMSGLVWADHESKLL